MNVLLLRNRINHGNIFPPVFRNPNELLQSYLNIRRRAFKPPFIYDIFKINFTNEAKRLGFNDQFLINHEANFFWVHASRQQKHHYTQLARDVRNLYFQSNARNYCPRNNSRSSQQQIQIRIQNNNPTLPILNNNILGNMFNDGFTFNSDFNMTFLNPWPN